MKNRPKRLTVQCDQSFASRLHNIPGCRRGRVGNFTFPPEEIIFYQLKKIFPDAEISEDLQNFIDNCLKFNRHMAELKRRSNVDLDLPDELYNYQKVDINFFLNNKRCINGNDMGLGKTVEAIMTVEKLDLPNVLIVCPSSIKYSWKKEIHRWVDKEALVVDGHKNERKSKLRYQFQYKIINYAMLRKGSYPYLLDQKWDMVIFDEAHRLKNRNSQQSRGASRLKSDRILMLTGSPIPNHPNELWHLLHILYPKRFTSYWQFVERFCELEEIHGSPVPKPNDLRNKKAFHYMLNPILIKRKKQDVLSELPDKIYKEIPLKLEGKQRNLYESMEKDMFARFEDGKLEKAGHHLTQLIRLQQLCLSPDLIHDTNIKGVKTKAILDLIDDIDGKICIFAKSKQYLYYLMNLIDGQYEYVYITGDVPSEERGNVEQKFQENDDIKLFFGTNQIAPGLNLQVSSTLIHAHKGWVPEDNKQVHNRIHRIGQKDSPVIISLVCQNTIEEDLEKVLKKKQDIIDESLCIEETIKLFKKRLSQLDEKRR